MRVNTPGFSTPEERLAPQPFYYALPPPIYRWNQLNYQYDAAQRWFYQCFCGRTDGSIWEGECGQQTDGTATSRQAQGDYSDPLNWTMPNFYRPAVAAAGYLGEPNAYANYIRLCNARPMNLKVGRPTVDTTVNPMYMATRHMYPRVAYRIAMKLPSAAEIANRGSTALGDTAMGVGFEVNSQGYGNACYLMLYDDGTNLRYHLASRAPPWDKNWTSNWKCWNMNLVTINNPDRWCWYEFEYDPPVFRFTQPQAGPLPADSDVYWSLVYPPDVTEVSIPKITANPHLQPFVCDESAVSTVTGNPLTWYVGQWAIWPVTNASNTWQVNTRGCPITACTPFSAIFDTGARPYLHINVKTLVAGCHYYIYHTEAGKDQVAGFPENRMWRRIDDADWTGVTDATREAGIGLFNASRFLCVVLEGPSNTCQTEEIRWTANSGGSTQ